MDPPLYSPASREAAGSSARLVCSTQELSVNSAPFRLPVLHVNKHRRLDFTVQAKHSASRHYPDTLVAQAECAVYEACSS